MCKNTLSRRGRVGVRAWANQTTPCICFIFGILINEKEHFLNKESMHQISKQTNKQKNMNLTIEIFSYQLIRFVY